MRLPLALIALLFFCSRAPAAPSIDLVVVGAGDDVFTLYGHAGMLVREDATTPLERGTLYNFGITRFDRPNYVQDFLTGRIEFWGLPQNFARNLERWRREDRTVDRYPLALTESEATWLAARLAYVTAPERRNFVYDTFRRNCATRLRDLLDEATGGAVWAALGEDVMTHSYRGDVRQAYAGRPGLLLLTEVVPGVELDRPRTRWELAYRPAALADGLARVSVPGPAGPRSLLGAPERLHTRLGPDPLQGSPNKGRAFLFVLVGLLSAVAWVVARVGARLRGGVLALYALTALVVGLVLDVVGATTDWPDMQRNWLAVAVVPLDVFLLWPAARLLIWRRNARTLARVWLAMRAATTLALVLVTPLWDAVHGPLAPRLLALAGLAVAWRCLGRPPSRVPTPRRPPQGHPIHQAPIIITSSSDLPPRNIGRRSES